MNFIIIQIFILSTRCFEMWSMKIISLDKKKRMDEDYMKQNSVIVDRWSNAVNTIKSVLFQMYCGCKQHT